MLAHTSNASTCSTTASLDWVIFFSIDGCDEESYRRYRIRGRFDVAVANLVRFHRNVAGTGIRISTIYGADRRAASRRLVTAVCHPRSAPALEPLQQLNLPGVIEVVRRDAADRVGRGIVGMSDNPHQRTRR